LSRARPLMAFLGSSAWITGMLVATAACLFPVMLRATSDPALSITAYNAGGSAQSLRVATGWWVIGFPIAIAYFVTLFRLHRRKVTPAQEGEGY
jgi:cytochrome d ubiquinol oxidase subunit II